MLPASLNCPFLIAPSVFSNVYVISDYHTWKQDTFNSIACPHLVDIRSHSSTWLHSCVTVLILADLNVSPTNLYISLTSTMTLFL